MSCECCYIGYEKIGNDFFLVHEDYSRSFCGVVANYVKEKLDESQHIGEDGKSRTLENVFSTCWDDVVFLECPKCKRSFVGERWHKNLEEDALRILKNE